MKTSIYNIFAECEEVVWGLNSRSGAFVRLTPQQYRNVKSLLAGELRGGETPEVVDLCRGLVKGQFLVPDDLDELELLKVKNRITRFAARGLGLIIAPTLRCNFKCPYCYVDLNTNKMAVQDRLKLKKFFANKLLEKSRAAVCWTGGDPSLALDVVEDLSRDFLRISHEKGAEYEAVMISNAYLLDRRMLGIMKRSQIRALQVTLDGARDHHNATRALANGKPTYDRILDNLGSVCDEIEINLRINVDGTNYHSIAMVLDDLVAKGLSGRIGVYFAHVAAVNKQSEGYRGQCLTVEDFARLEPKFLHEALLRGFRISGRVLAQPVGSFCGANSFNQFVIDPKARLLKCYEDLGTAAENEVGYIDENGREIITMRNNLVDWLAWDPFEIEECRACRMLPLCMGGCSYYSIRNSLAIGTGCLMLRYNASQILQLLGERLSREREQFACTAVSTNACPSL